MPDQVVFGKFRVRLQKVTTPLPPPAEGTSTTYVYPELLHAPGVRYGVIRVNPQDDADVLLAVTGPKSVLDRLGSAGGVTVLSEREAQDLLQQWG